MKEHSNEGDIIFDFSTDQYSRLAFFNDKDRYVVGMDPTFLFAYDPSLYWKYKHIAASEPICPEATCSGNTEDIYGAIKDDFKARYIFIDLDYAKGSLVKLENDPRFALAFTDQEKPSIRVYEVK